MTKVETCPCQSNVEYKKCCGVFIEKESYPTTVVELMKSRYTAYAKGKVQYIIDTAHPDKREESDEEGIKSWSKAEWHGLRIIKSTQKEDVGEVEFIATYSEKGIKKEHHEISTFKKHENEWFFYTGKILQTKINKVGRNDPCSCGSGKKYKKCCGK